MPFSICKDNPKRLHQGAPYASSLHCLSVVVLLPTIAHLNTLGKIDAEMLDAGVISCTSARHLLSLFSPLLVESFALRILLVVNQLLSIYDSFFAAGCAVAAVDQLSIAFQITPNAAAYVTCASMGMKLN
mmetsp:Transcript_39219/g.66857  ORF Transcript_39219/g.66857 Transcript_39219/m.66857 type:complete len:130 (+) Transcript_39219:49-438(+)